MIQTCHLKKIKAATRNEQFFVFSSPAVDPKETLASSKQWQIQCIKQSLQ